jgi:hypothetical protein
MALVYAYEPEYRKAGWFDNSARTAPQWFDRDLVEDPPKNLMIFAPDLFLDDDIFFADAHAPFIRVELLPALFDDADLFFIPSSVRALDVPDQMLRNEVWRVR